MMVQKLYNRFHVGKSRIHVGNFEKNIFFQVLKDVVNRLPPFKNLSDHANRFLMG